MNATGDSEYIGGLHAVTAAIEQGRSVDKIWLAARRDDARATAIRRLAEHHDIAVGAVDMARLDTLLPDVRHQGCIARLRAAHSYHEAELLPLLAGAPRPWVLALDQVQDPHNLGACLRSAAAAGVTAVIAPRKRAAGLSAAARKVAAGAAERVAFIPVTNLSRTLASLQNEGFWVIGLAADAPSSIHQADWPDRLILVAGGEAAGLRRLTKRHCDALVCIPMASGMESLNISVATGVALFEAARARRVSASGEQ